MNYNEEIYLKLNDKKYIKEVILKDIYSEVQNLIFKGQKIKAIKLVRENSNLGLKEAKKVIEDLTNDLNLQYPNQIKKPGCFVLVLSSFFLFFIIFIVVFINNFIQ